MKTILIIPAIIVYALTACKTSAQVYSSPKTDTCINILKSYSHYWKKDSLGDNGFRELLSEKVLRECNCKGREWKKILEYLGKPSSTHAFGEETEYRYRLNHFSNDVKMPGTLFLDISVNKEGIVTYFYVREVDG